MCKLGEEQASEQPSSLASDFPSDRVVWFGGVISPLGAGDSRPSGLVRSCGRNTWHLSSIKVTRIVEFFLSENCLGEPHLIIVPGGLCSTWGLDQTPICGLSAQPRLGRGGQILLCVLDFIDGPLASQPSFRSLSGFLWTCRGCWGWASLGLLALAFG